MRKPTLQRHRERVLAYVAAHRSPCSLTVETLIAGTAMTRSTLYRALEPEGGVNAFLFTVRLDTARQLIEAGEPLAAVTKRCGFRTSEHLQRRFKAAYGVTPRQHRSVVTNTARSAAVF